MKLGVVVGQVVATVKHAALQHDRLLLVQIIGPDGTPTADIQVAVDSSLGAGNGEWVLLVSGSSARKMVGDQAPIDLSVIGIVDEVVLKNQVAYHK